MNATTELRPLEQTDLERVFAMMREPEAVSMAAFTAENPDDREAFDAHMARLLVNPDVHNWAVLSGGGEFVGTIATFRSEEGAPEVTYWISQAHWGQGHASRALALVLARTKRPVLARVAADNYGSLRILQKAGFVVVGQGRDYAPGRHAEVDELALELP